MKKNLKYSIYFLAMVCSICSLSFLTSCEEPENPSEVVLLSFGPSGVNHGDEITFFGQNLDKVTAIVLKPNVEIPKSSFKSVSSERINIIVPVTAEAGIVLLKTPQGDIESKTILNFNVPVVIGSITAEAKPGTNITITGENINWIEDITFPSDLKILKDDFVSRSPTEVVVTVPMEAQTGFLIFTLGGTSGMTFGTEEQLIVTLPAVTSLAPTLLNHTEELTITGTDLDLITSIVFGGDITATTFVSQSETEIVVAVPVGAKAGTVTLKQASPIDIVTTGTITIVLPAGTSVTPSPAVPGTDNITITGTNLDLIAELTLPSATPILASGFVSQSATQIVLAVPEGTKSGGIVYKTIYGYSDNLGIAVVVPGVGPAPLPFTLYDEAIAAGGGNQSWDGTSVLASTEQFYSGDVSWKFTTTAAGGLSGGNITAMDVTSQESFIFALYGGDLGGASSVNVAAILNDKWDSYNAVQLTPGQWTEYEIPMSSYPTVDFSQIVRFAFKVEGISSSTIYADYVGFGAKTTPAPLDLVVFDNVLADGLEVGGWGEDYSDFANTEVYRRGRNAHSIKVDFPGGWGGGGQIVVPDGEDNMSLAGMTKFAFSVYGGEGSNGVQIQVNLKVDADNPKTVTLKEGEWVDVEIPISDFAAITEFKEIWFQDRGTAVTVYIDNIGFRE